MDGKTDLLKKVLHLIDKGWATTDKAGSEKQTHKKTVNPHAAPVGSWHKRASDTK